MQIRGGMNYQPASGNHFPPDPQFGDEFYLLPSGFFKHGETRWQQYSYHLGDYPISAFMWEDNQVGGTPITLTTGGTYYIYTSAAASGGSFTTKGDHSYFEHTTSGFYLRGPHALVCNVKYDVAFGGTGNSTYRSYIFINENRQNQTAMHRRLGATGDVGSAGGNGIITISPGDFISLRFAAINNTKVINLYSASITISEITQIT